MIGFLSQLAYNTCKWCIKSLKTEKQFKKGVLDGKWLTEVNDQTVKYILSIILLISNYYNYVLYNYLKEKVI